MRFETVVLSLYDLGNELDLEACGQRFGPQVEAQNLRGRDTPSSLILPPSLGFQVFKATAPVGPFYRFELWAKLYRDAVLSLSLRCEADLELGDLHRVRHTILPLDGRRLTIDQYLEYSFRELLPRLKPYIDKGHYEFKEPLRETYACYCLCQNVGDPRAYLEANSGYLAPFLLGENPKLALHQSQVASTMGNVFSFLEDDAAIFDLERCLIISPGGDYGDLISIVEHANYQLLELKTIDALLGRWMRNAERGLGSKRLARGANSNSGKIRRLQSIGFDARFLLEKLENSSRIIGEYHLERVYSHLLSMFNTQGWRSNIERKQSFLGNLYAMARSDRMENTMLFLETLVAVMIAIELVPFFVSLFSR